jgi:membrane-bound metal-dependent hydrolase YbcI (DUF457 family)
MKNIAHFASGLVIASFVPGVMEDATRGSLLVALGGLCAMLPDTLDFKLARFLERRDADIIPDVHHPDPQAIADEIAMQMYLTERDQRPRIVQLHPARRSAVEWVLYTLRFDVVTGNVIVTMDHDGSQGRAQCNPIRYTYDGDLHIEDLGGPSLRFSPLAAGAGVEVEFLPFHRVWSHSLILALAIGVLCGLVIDPRAGLVAALGYGIHILEDQLGYMGSNLLAPFTRGRSNGLSLLHSGDAIPNMTTIWLSMTLLLLNMDRARTVPLIAVGPYLAFVVLAPAALLLVIYVRRQWRKHVDREKVLEPQRQRDLVAEAEEYQG